MNDERLPLFAAFQVVPIAVLCVDHDKHIRFANPHAERLFGHPRARLETVSIESLLSAESHASFTDALRDSLAGAHGAEAHLELFATSGRGERMPVEVSVRAVGDADRSLAVVVVRDVTAQKRAEASRAAAALEALEARTRLEAMLEYAPAWIIAISRGGTIDYINRLLPQYERKDVIGSNWLDYFQPERQALMQAELEHAYATNSTRTFETTTPGPNGEALWFSSDIAPILGDGPAAGAVLVSQDITEKKRVLAELLASRHMALLGTLAAGVAHEINTPIQFVGDSIQFLREATQDLFAFLGTLQGLLHAGENGAVSAGALAEAAAAEEAADLPYLLKNIPAAFERCVDGLHRVSTIVRSLKEFSHPVAKEMQATDLNHTVQGALTIATNEYKYVADIVTELGELPAVLCNSGEIGQVLVNIIVNAAHAIGDVIPAHSGERGLITVRTAVEGGNVLISIGDTGGGIPEPIRARIFDPFFTTKAVGKGTGQGLALAWTTVHDRHGGKLYVETEVGRGSTFFIQLPIAGPALHAA